MIKSNRYAIKSGLPLIKIAIVALSCFILSIVFLLGVYFGSRDTVVIGKLRTMYRISTGFEAEMRAKADAEMRAKADAEMRAKADAEMRAKADAEMRAKMEAEARTNKATREALITRNGGFKEANLGILSKLSEDNRQRYLYADLDFILDKNPKYCPSLGAEFLKNFAGHQLDCFRIVYKKSELNTFGIRIKPMKRLVGDLLIYNHGHGGFPTSQEEFATKLILGALSAGHDVLLVSLPFTGVDEVIHSVKVKTWDGWAVFNPVEAKNFPSLVHGMFELIDTGKTHYIRHFVDSAVISAFALKNSYKNINYIGLSGGATVGLNVCALLKDILAKCILVSGVMPAKFRLNGKDFGDSEQVSSGLLRRNTVIDLLKEIAKSRTKLYLLYSAQDSCCFGNPAADNLKQYLVDVRLANVGVFIRDSNVHGYDHDFVLELFGFND